MSYQSTVSTLIITLAAQSEPNERTNIVGKYQQ